MRVAVICHWQRTYIDFIRSVYESDCNFVKVSKFEDIRGVQFDSYIVLMDKEIDKDLITLVKTKLYEQSSR